MNRPQRSRRTASPSTTAPASAALAIAAHPDDIEFGMAGTLLLLKQAGWQLHYLNLSTGNCGSVEHNAAQTRRLRRKEAQRAARLLEARWHAGFCDDLEILYDLPTLRRLAALVRLVKPAILLTHSPEDYMEDHMNTCRLAVTAAFSRGMPNFRTAPPRPPMNGEMTLYHAMPHGLCDQLRRPVVPDAFVDTTAVHARKREALAAHGSQKSWLDRSQGMNSYLQSLDEMSRAVGRLSGRFEHAEGWRRHSHLGFSATDQDPLAEVLREKYLIHSQ